MARSHRGEKKERHKRFMLFMTWFDEATVKYATKFSITHGFSSVTPHARIAASASTNCIADFLLVTRYARSHTMEEPVAS